jgi:hypothetical protein
MRFLLATLLLCLAGQRTTFAQTDSTNIPNSENGSSLSPHGTIRVLVLFCEIVYDKNPGKDPQSGGADHWPKGQLPTWKDDLFDPQPKPLPTATITRYYHDISLGDYVVLGDYIDQELVLKESEYPEVSSAHSVGSAAVKEANKMGSLRTHYGLKLEDFDLWTDGGKPGLPKKNVPDEPHRYDHVMVIARNSGLTHGQGSTDPGSPGKLFGYESDTQSRFGGMNALPFEILKHEFNHLLLGGNNFHSGGGNASQFQGYFIPLQGGWSMMGAASSSLLTCSGWDRYRLGWKAKDAPFPITAGDANERRLNGDLDPLKGDTGIFTLRDFVTSGDAIRIRMPFLGSDEFPQWLWLENHQTWSRNGSPTDRFHYENEMTCVRKAAPGIFATMQVDREQKRGKDIYGGDADYLRAIPASGFNDYYLRGDTVTYQCLWSSWTLPLVAKKRWSNPLTGASELEIPVFDTNKDGVVSRSKEGIMPRVEERDGAYLDEAMFFGHARQAFTPQGNSGMSMCSDPALANMLTLVSTPGKDAYKRGRPNNRTVHLAGLSVKLLEQRTDGSILVRIRNNDTFVDRDVRWCADSIVLHAVNGHEGHALHVGKGRTVLIDRSRTPTRLDKPQEAGGFNYFSNATAFTVEEGALVHLETGATLDLQNGSTLHLLPGAVLSLANKARVLADGSSRIVLHGSAVLKATRKQLKKLNRRGRVERRS